VNVYDKFDIPIFNLLKLANVFSTSQLIHLHSGKDILNDRVEEVEDEHRSDICNGHLVDNSMEACSHGQHSHTYGYPSTANHEAKAATPTVDSIERHQTGKGFPHKDTRGKNL
jgi:ketol-acid reductoisomerase